MKTWLSFGLILLLPMAVSALAAGKGDATAGKALYSSKCAPCHGASGEGKEAIGKMFKVQMPHLGSKEVQAKSDAELRKNISEGNGKMKPVKLSDEEAANVIAYVRSLAKK